MSKTIILDQAGISNRIRRIAYQIYEVNTNEKEIILAGIDKNGYIFAKRLVKVLQDISDLKVTLCKVEVNKKAPLEPIKTSIPSADYINKSIVVVDDVLNGGTTLMYAVKHFLDVPLKQIKTAVMVDRNHKKFPIKVDFKGISLSTSMQNHIEMVFLDKGDEAYLE